jgi:hypothetical protein
VTDIDMAKGLGATDIDMAKGLGVTYRYGDKICLKNQWDVCEGRQET